MIPVTEGPLTECLLYLQKLYQIDPIFQDIVTRGGRCLIPVFALGRAQELLLILDEYWAAHPELHEIPIYYASSLAKKCMAVYQVTQSTVMIFITDMSVIMSPPAISTVFPIHRIMIS